MRRRDVIGLLGAAAAWPLTARAQQGGRVRRVGVLMLGEETDRDQSARVAAFRETLGKLGWIENGNIRIDSRFAATDAERIRLYSAQLVSQTPDAILANGTPVLEALRKQTQSIPIVFVGVSDPVSAGFVPSLARPGGNVTGFSNFEYTIGGKWLEILKEAAPSTKRVGVLLHREDAAWARYLATIEALAPSLGIQLARMFLGDSAETERTLDAFKQGPAGGLIVTNNARAMTQRELIGALAARYRLPAIYPARVYASSGGLMSYGIDPVEPYRHAASYVDRILRGERPGEMPVQQPTKFEFVVNLRTAKALGLVIPLPLLGRADEVIG
jgi:putative ABC transport system substrate-binding protein